jgi:glycopeptide antibiotics resistance protein
MASDMIQLDKLEFLGVHNMVEISFLFLEIVFASIWLVIRFVVWIKQRHIDWKREAVLLLMYINLAVIIRFTFFPMSKVDGQVQPLVFDIATAFPFRVNLFPLVNLFDYDSKRDLLLNVIGNVAMFIPSGIVLPIIYKRLDTFVKVLLAGGGISLCIEIIQLPFSVRATDIDDLILNTVGVIVGYGIYALIRYIRRIKK